jgi:hypothetical protein
MGDEKVDDEGHVYERDWLSGEYRRKETFWGGEVRETDIFGQPKKGKRAETWWGGEVKSAGGRPLYEPKGSSGGDVAGNVAGGLTGCLLSLIFGIFFWWISFCWRKPKIGLPVTAVLLIVLYFSFASGQSPATAVQNRPSIASRSAQPAMVSTRPRATNTPWPTSRLSPNAPTLMPRTMSVEQAADVTPNPSSVPLNKGDAPPAPRILSVQTIPEQVSPGQPFRVRVEATNEGGATVDGYISVSFPDNPILNIVSHSATGESDGHYIVEPGGKLYHFPDGGTVEAVYPIAEARIRNWPAGIIHHLEVEVTPRGEVQRTSVYARVSLSWRSLEDIYIEPESSATIDQQGFPVYSYRYP